MVRGARRGGAWRGVVGFGIVGSGPDVTPTYSPSLVSHVQSRQQSSLLQHSRLFEGFDFLSGHTSDSSPEPQALESLLMGLRGQMLTTPRFSFRNRSSSDPTSSVLPTALLLRSPLPYQPSTGLRGPRWQHSHKPQGPCLAAPAHLPAVSSSSAGADSGS